MATLEKKCIIFDWDGTLINSSPCVIQAHHKAAELLDLPPHDMAILNSMLGQPSGVVSKLLTNGTSVNALDYQCCFRDAYQNISQNIQLYDYVIPLIERLHAIGHKCTIATNKPEKIAAQEIIRTGVSRLFIQKEYACQTEAKPDPAMLQKILDTQGTTVNQCIMVGDQTNDADAAKALNMDCIIVHDSKQPIWRAQYGKETVFIERNGLSQHLTERGVLQPMETIKSS